jgi:hypothetical protein
MTIRHITCHVTVSQLHVAVALRSQTRTQFSPAGNSALFISNALLHILMRRIRGYLFREVVFLPYHMHAAQLPVAMHLALGMHTVSVPHGPDGSVLRRPFPCRSHTTSFHWTDGGRNGLGPFRHVTMLPSRPLDGHLRTFS